MTSVFQLRDGKWRAQVSVGPRSARRYVTRTRATREEAVEALGGLALPDSQTFEGRFWAKVDRGDSCWLWTGVRDHNGYGQIVQDGKLRQAHRVAWELANGPIEDGLYVCHQCDVKACVRADHLFLGTQSDNMRDYADKRRSISKSRDVSRDSRAASDERG
jgi:hypothetical protein